MNLNVHAKVIDIIERMKQLPEEKQDELLDRLVARQRNAELLSEMNLQAAARVGLILRQMKYDRDYNAKS
jgi:flagellar motility protein MotE (MotC chaperone)